MECWSIGVMGQINLIPLLLNKFRQGVLTVPCLFFIGKIRCPQPGTADRLLARPSFAAGGVGILVV
jgi:hypothetical protein